jgi:hypothetical protein
MSFSDAAFMPPVALRELLAKLDDWPSPDLWPFVPLDTVAVTMDTPVAVLSFDRDEAFDDEEYEVFERWTLTQGWETFLNRDQLQDVRDSLGYEIEALNDQRDLDVVNRNYEAILIRAINHYNEMDAFVSLKDWVGAGGMMMKGILAEYA